MELRDLLGNARTIKLFDDALTVIYKPGAVTLGEMGNLTNTQFLARVVISWDLTIDGQPLALTEEELTNAPVGAAGVMGEIAAEIYQDMATFPKGRLRKAPLDTSEMQAETAKQ